MPIDGCFIHYLVDELNNEILNFKINKIYQPAPLEIVLQLRGKNSDGLIVNKQLLLSSKLDGPRLHLLTKKISNPEVPNNFCMLLRKHILGYKIKSISTIDLERIIFIDLENNDNPNKPLKKKLIIELMGKHSNIILTDQYEIIIDSLRHTNIEHNSNRDVYPTAKYLFPQTSKYSFLQLKDFNDFYDKIEPKLTEYIINQSEEISSLNISSYNIDKIISNTFNGISISFVKSIINTFSINSISKQALEEIYIKINDIIHSTYYDFILLDNNYETTNDLQTDLYDVVKDDNLIEKELKVVQKRYFEILYNLLLGQNKGPKLGLFLMAIDKEKIKELL